MKTFTIGDKVYTEKQLASAIKRMVEKKDLRPLNRILDDIPPEGDAEPVYREIVLSVRDDPAARYLASRKLERGLEGFGAIEPFLRMAELFIDLYMWIRRKKTR
jgi:hypothetical protein